MEIHFTPETEQTLNDVAAHYGSGTAEELVQNVVEAYVGELARTRDLLTSRYDDLESGKVEPMPGDDVEAYFREKSAAARNLQQGS